MRLPRREALYAGDGYSEMLLASPSATKASVDGRTQAGEERGEDSPAADLHDVELRTAVAVW